MNKRIKPTLIIILSLICILSILTVGISATAQEPLSEQTAKELLFKSIDFAHRVYIPMEGLQYDTSKTKIIHPYYYSPVIEENLPGGSYEAMKEYATTIYTNDIAENMYSHCRSHYDNPIFIRDDNGKLLMTSNESSFYMTWWYDVLDWTDYSINDVTFELVNSDKQKATVWFKCTKESYGDFWIECCMINTDNGWRIAESPFTHFLEWGESRANLWEQGMHPINPSTGDSAGERVAVIGAVSLACIIPTACLMRRRRRRDTI